MQVDAIVNTTNADMVGYSGVDLAVHEGAGPMLDVTSRRELIEIYNYISSL